VLIDLLSEALIVAICKLYMNNKTLEAGTGGIGGPVDERLPQFGKPDPIPGRNIGKSYEAFSYRPETYLPWGRKPLTVLYRYNDPADPDNRKATVIAAYRGYEPDTFHFDIGRTITIPKGAQVSSEGFRRAPEVVSERKPHDGFYPQGRKKRN
jgi:hypothetical protein